MTPALLQERVPVRDETLPLVETSRAAIADVLHGRDDRLVVVVGPCSIHDHDQALEYGHRLKGVADELRQDLLIVDARLLREATHHGGLEGLHQRPAHRWQLRDQRGLERARRLLLELTALGLPTGTEFLDLLSPQFIADLIAWGAIGARTTESQSHRQLASD